ncbi:AmiS/UreI family transporter [Rummeliibacillus sp. JY-2-4R]
MSNVGLLYVGCILFINGLMILGKIDGKSAGVFNIFIGCLQIFTPIYLIITANGDSATILSAAGLFLFGFTYLYVGISNLADFPSNGVGYYSLWVSILAFIYAFINISYFSDLKFGLIWLMWSFLWLLFYLLLARGANIAIYTGWVALIQSWITCTIPAILLLIGEWDIISNSFMIAIFILAVLTFVVLYYILNVKSTKNPAKNLTNNTSAQNN